MLCFSSFEGKFDAVWDRGALVAINESDRKQYVLMVLRVLVNVHVGPSSASSVAHTQPNHIVLDFDISPQVL